MPQSVFREVARLCGLSKTTYTPTHGWLLDSVMIDFTAEPDPKHAYKCFNDNLQRADQVLSINGKQPDHFGYIWDTRA